MACLVKDPRNRSKYWICAYTAPDGRRLKKSTKQTDKQKAWQVCLSFMEAETAVATGSRTEHQIRRVIDSALRRAGETPLADATVRETLDTWIREKSGALAPMSLKLYKQAATLLLKFLGPRADRSIRLFTKRDAVAFRDWLSEGRSPSTVNRLKAHLGGAFESAKEEGVLEQNVFSFTQNLKVAPLERDTFTPEQVARLVAAAPSNDWKGMIILAYTSAARLMDAANMKWSNIDMENELLEFKVQKTGKRALLALHPDFISWLATQQVPDSPHAFLFPSLAGKRGAGKFGLSNQFKKIMAEANITGRQVISSHGARNFQRLASTPSDTPQPLACTVTRPWNQSLNASPSTVQIHSDVTSTTTWKSYAKPLSLYNLCQRFNAPSIPDS
jgi:integrase